MAWIEEGKKTTEFYTERSDWFYRGWFLGWFSFQPTPSYIEETKNTIDWTEEVK